ncbi:MAG: extracellular solute-binding protein [Candidatus Zixiibacteriota bacterium]|nr:MAG: extracellular solute-binding protein [candidate division Zixibacteria bacterium]
MRLPKLIIALLFFTLIGTAQATTRITWWQFWTDPNIKPTIDAMVDEFERANPDIKVELTDLTWANGHEKIVIAFSSGMGPDVVELGSDWIAQFADAGQLADISGDVSEDSAGYQGWGMATYRDRIYAYPWFLGTRLMFLNQDLLNRAGYEADFLPFNTDGFKEVAFKVDSLGDDIYGFGSNTVEKHRLYKKYLPFFWSAGGRIFTPDNKYCVISSMQAIGALEFYKMLHDSCGFVGTQREIEDAFLDGRIGFIISGDWLLKRIALENRDVNMVLTNVPGPKYPGKSFLGGEFLAVNARTEHKEAALKLIRFITSPDNQVRFCKANHSANPSSLVAQEDEYFLENEHLQAFIRQIRASVHPPVDPDWVHIEDIIEEAVEDALFGSGLPATALREAQIKITELKRKQ